jgi:tetratricopeptide (TPR) repeat protein
MYSIKKEVYKDAKGAFGLYENFMKNNYDYSVYYKYASLLADASQNDKALDVKKKLAEIFPYVPSGFYDLSKYYYTSKQYDKAEEQIKKALAISPYNESYWEQLGDIQSEKKNIEDAFGMANRNGHACNSETREVNTISCFFSHGEIDRQI